jgi:hypothetical protein
MGNPNARPKKTSMVSLGKRLSVDSNCSKISSVSPKAAPKKEGANSAEKVIVALTANGDEAAEITTQFEGPGVVDTKSNGEAIAHSDLRFKSWKTGTLITHNGEPSHLSGLSIQPLLPPKTVKSLLSATSPAFVPATQKRPQGPQQTATYPLAATSVDKIKSMLSNRFPIPVETPSPFRPRSHNANFFATPTKSPSAAITVNSPHEMTRLPQKAPHTFLTRADRERKDIIITSYGVTRNVIRITERYLPNGLQYRNFSDEYKSSNYDLIKDVAGMTKNDRIEFWNKQNVEIIVDFRGEVDNKNINNGKQFGENGSKGKEVSQLGEKEGIVAMIEILGPDFAAYTKNIYITVYFPTSKTRSSALKTIAKSNTTKEAHPTPKKLPPTVAVTEAIVKNLHNFSRLEKLEINLHTPANNKTPLSIDALDHLLPFYDLAFTDWEIRWQTDYMSRSEPVKGWPIFYLDRERNKILWEREKKQKSVRKAVFVTNSIAHSVAGRGAGIGIGDGAGAGTGDR